MQRCGARCGEGGLTDLGARFCSLRPGCDELVIADFGIAKHLDPGEVLTSLAGSPGYAAPEVLLHKGHGSAVDLWSIGVITYTLYVACCTSCALG